MWLRFCHTHLYLLLIFSLVQTPAYALADGPKVDLSELETVILAELKSTNTPGAAVAVLRGDQLLFAKGFGVASVETGVPVTPDMLFRLGSTTKMLVSAAMVQLAEEGKIKLDEPIGTYVKELPPKIAKLTVHQLLTHTAGLTDDSPMFGLHDDSALPRGIRAMKDEVFFTEPGKIYSYSNLGYWIAGVVLEEVDKRAFADAMRARLFMPLGMERTTFRPTLAVTYPFALGHHVEGKGKPKVVRPLADNAATWPAGQMFSNVHEFARWASAFLNEGKLDGKQILSPSLIAKLATGHVDRPMSGGKYGYGLGSSEVRGVHILAHGGSRMGYGSLLTMAPRERIALIILANKTGASLPRTAEKAMELLLPLKPKAKEIKKELPMTAAEMARYAGTYTNHRQTVKLLVKDEQLITDKGEAIRRIGQERFQIMSKDRTPVAEFGLVAGADGTVEYLIRQARALKKVAQ